MEMLVEGRGEIVYASGHKITLPLKPSRLRLVLYRQQKYRELHLNLWRFARCSRCQDSRQISLSTRYCLPDDDDV
jgi:hypothetical protein